MHMVFSPQREYPAVNLPPGISQRVKNRRNGKRIKLKRLLVILLSFVMTLVPMPTAAFTLEYIEGDSDIKRPYEVVSTEALENAPMISMETIKQQS